MFAQNIISCKNLQQNACFGRNTFLSGHIELISIAKKRENKNLSLFTGIIFTDLFIFAESKEQFPFIDIAFLKIYLSINIITSLCK